MIKSCRSKIIMTREVFNGDIGRITGIRPEEYQMTVTFDGRDVAYEFSDLDEIVLAYAVSVHKSQGSEYPAVVIPILTQHYILLQRNFDLHGHNQRPESGGNGRDPESAGHGNKHPQNTKTPHFVTTPVEWNTLTLAGGNGLEGSNLLFNFTGFYISDIEIFSFHIQKFS